jgi:hypothetical protein
VSVFGRCALQPRVGINWNRDGLPHADVTQITLTFATLRAQLGRSSSEDSSPSAQGRRSRLEAPASGRLEAHGEQIRWRGIMSAKASYEEQLNQLLEACFQELGTQNALQAHCMFAPGRRHGLYAACVGEIH